MRITMKKEECLKLLDVEEFQFDTEDTTNIQSGTKRKVTIHGKKHRNGKAILSFNVEMDAGTYLKTLESTLKPVKATPRKKRVKKTVTEPKSAPAKEAD